MVAINEALKVCILDDEQCIIWSVNVKQAPVRLEALSKHIATLSRPPDIIAIQDPPRKFAYMSFGVYGHWYRAADDENGQPETLTRDNDPSLFPYRVPYSRKPPEEKVVKDLCKVAFLVHKSLKGCRVTEPNGDNRGIVATLHVPLVDGYTIAIHNVYNHEKRLDVASLCRPMLSASKAHVLVGDFNLHHPLWAGDDLPNSKIEAKARVLVSHMYEADMRCLNNGNITYRNSEESRDQRTSVLDLVFLKNVLLDSGQVGYKLLENVLGYESDHIPSSLAINLDMHREYGVRYQWQNVSKDEFQDGVEQALRQMAPRELVDTADVENGLKDVIACVESAIRDFVPVVKLNEPNPRPSRYEAADSATRTRRWHRTVDKMASDGIFNLSKRAHKWSVPRQMAYTPDFVFGGYTYESNEDKANCYVQATWTDSRRKGPSLSSKSSAESPPEAVSFAIPSLELYETTNPDSSRCLPHQTSRCVSSIPTGLNILLQIMLHLKKS